MNFENKKSEESEEGISASDALGKFKNALIEELGQRGVQNEKEEKIDPTLLNDATFNITDDGNIELLYNYQVKQTVKNNPDRQGAKIYKEQGVRDSMVLPESISKEVFDSLDETVRNTFIKHYQEGIAENEARIDSAAFDEEDKEEMKKNIANYKKMIEKLS